MTDVRAEFEAHWHAGDATGVSAAKLTEAGEFLEPLSREPVPVNLARVLDVGCGDGVHAHVLATRNGGVRYCGADLSMRALRAAAQHAAAPFTFQQADVRHLPYGDRVFDVVFSYGVIGYTGAAQQVLDEMVRVCRPGGTIGVWVYPEGTGLGAMLFRATRRFCRLVGPRLSRPVIWLVALLLPVLPVRSGITIFNSTWRQCLEVVEVNLLPTHLDFYSEQDVLGWFESRNIEVIFVDRRRPVAVWGRREARNDQRFAGE